MSQEINSIIPGALIEYSPHPEKADKPVFVSWHGMFTFLEAMKADLHRWCGDVTECYKLDEIAQCKALFYIPYVDGCVSAEACAAATLLFKRDGDQALVFEWDRIDRIFRCKSLEYFQNPKRIL